MNAGSSSSKSLVPPQKAINAQLQTKVLGYELYLGVPVGIESQEVDCFLNWLKNTENLSRCQRWLVAVSFKLTAKAAVIREYLDTKSVAPTTFTQELDHLYSGFSRVIHLKRPYPPAESDEESWKEIFDNLQMYSITTQDTFKAIVLHFDVPNACAVNFPDIIKNDEDAKANGGYLLIKNLNRNVDLNSVVEYFENNKVIVYDSLNLLDSKTQKNDGTFLLRVGDLKVARQLAHKLPEDMKDAHFLIVTEAHGFNEI
ncbi:uncharacterized protein LOC135845987 isoform X2 [Planococcus citri]|uniref:uncharacterized protein LOC135845987 isoform X2 n=1 Tax=Planococcus citri TaxID=170843 RepID=UPI0031F7D791